jgi:hypothetical protein
MQHAIFQISPENEDGTAERARAMPSPSLLFVDQPGQVDGWIAACSDLLETGKTKIEIRVLDGAFSPIGEQLIGRFGDRLVSLASPNDGGPKQAAGTETSAVLLLGGDADCVSTALMDYIDEMAATVLAPVTERFWNRLPLYLISMPKAGTHLLFQLAEALGYRSGGPSPESPIGGCWYYLLNINAHTGADEFFLEATQKAPFGNRAHPFLRAPALFNYRHPLDILASEASYFHLDGNSPLSILLSPLSFDERAVLLADDHWLLGSIRDRAGRFLPWLGCTNVIPVSFEEMVGTAGGGSDAVLERLIWSLQLKLHIPGSPPSFRSAIRRKSSPTFRDGRIGGWQGKLPAAAVQRVRALPQDFMAAFGYELDDVGDAQPAQAEARRRRPLALSRAEFAETPILIATNVLGHNIVSLRKRFFAVPIATGQLDLAALSDAELAEFPQGNTQAEVFAALIAQTASDAERPDTLRAVVRDEFSAMSDAMPALVRNELQKLLAARPDALLAVVRDELTAMSDAMRVLVHGELQKLLAARPEALLAVVRDELQTLRALDRNGAVRSRGGFLGYNIFQRLDDTIAVPRRLGAIDPADPLLRERPGVIAARSANTVRLAVMWCWIRWAYWDGARG